MFTSFFWVFLRLFFFFQVDNEDELDSSKAQEQACIIDDNSEKIKPPDSGETETQEAGIVEVAENTKEKEIMKINSTKKEEVSKV